MNRSVKDIARTLGTNKNVIYRIIDKLGLEPVTDSDSASKVYSDGDQLLIRDEYKKIKTKHQDDGTKQPLSENSTLIDLLQEQIRRLELDNERLQDQLDRKDQDLREMTARYTELSAQLISIKKRDQDLKALELNTKSQQLLIESDHSHFNLFRPSTWKRNKNTAKTVSYTPVSSSDDNDNQSGERTSQTA